MNENFYFVYELPDRAQLSDGFTFNKGVPIPFLNVDWFGDAPVGPALTQEQLKEFVKEKRYIRPGRRYLVLGSPGHTFVLEPNE